MPVQIPPSPKASQVPEYSERIHAVREIARAKRPTKRLWKDKAKETQPSTDETARHAAPKPLPKAPSKKPKPQVREFLKKAQGQSQDSAPAKPAAKQHVRKPRLAAKVPHSAQHSQPQGSQGTMVLTAIAASVVVSLAVNFALQGMPASLITGMATVAGSSLVGAGWGL